MSNQWLFDDKLYSDAHADTVWLNVVLALGALERNDMELLHKIASTLFADHDLDVLFKVVITNMLVIVQPLHDSAIRRSAEGNIVDFVRGNIDQLEHRIKDMGPDDLEAFCRRREAIRAGTIPSNIRSIRSDLPLNLPSPSSNHVPRAPISHAPAPDVYTQQFGGSAPGQATSQVQPQANAPHSDHRSQAPSPANTSQTAAAMQHPQSVQPTSISAVTDSAGAIRYSHPGGRYRYILPGPAPSQTVLAPSSYTTQYGLLNTTYGNALSSIADTNRAMDRPATTLVTPHPDDNATSNSEFKPPHNTAMSAITLVTPHPTAKDDTGNDITAKRVKLEESPDASEHLVAAPNQHLTVATANARTDSTSSSSLVHRRPIRTHSVTNTVQNFTSTVGDDIKDDGTRDRKRKRREEIE